MSILIIQLVPELNPLPDICTVTWMSLWRISRQYKLPPRHTYWARLSTTWATSWGQEVYWIFPTQRSCYIWVAQLYRFTRWWISLVKLFIVWESSAYLGAYRRKKWSLIRCDQRWPMIKGRYRDLLVVYYHVSWTECKLYLRETNIPYGVIYQLHSLHYVLWWKTTDQLIS